MEILFLIIGFILGGVIISFCLYPKIKQRIKKDTATEQHNQRLKEEAKRLESEADQLSEQKDNVWKDFNAALAQKSSIEKEIDEIRATEKETIAKCQTSINAKKEEVNTLDKEIYSLQAQKLTLEEAFQKMSVSAEEAQRSIEKAAMEITQTHFEAAVEKERQAYFDNVNKFKEGYAQITTEAIGEFNVQISNKQKELADISIELEGLSKKVDAAQQSYLREQEKENKDFYRVQISAIDALEIEKIKSILPYLRNDRPLAKAIWECYYRNPTNDLVGRIVGAGRRTGIYKITSLLDNRIYIGQAVDLGDRLKQHAKCAVGIDTPNTKLYQAMTSSGLENFMFEVLIECPSEELNEQEKYWIDFYKSNIYGYNMNAGGAKQK